MTLSNLELGKTAVITAVHGSRAICRRLQEVGFIPNAQVKCIMRSPFGDPTAYGICATVIALRRCDSQLIEITEREDENGINS